MLVRLLFTATSLIQIWTSLKNHKWGTQAKEWATHSSPPKNIQKVGYPSPPPLKRLLSISLSLSISVSLSIHMTHLVRLSHHCRRLAHKPPKFSLIHITNFRRGRVCGNANCANCTAVDCGSCRRCLKPSAKNKCIRRFSSIFIFMISCITFLQKLCHVLTTLTYCMFVCRL